MTNRESTIAANWPSFSDLWKLVIIIWVIILILLWVFGFGPGGKNCQSATVAGADCGEESVVDAGDKETDTTAKSAAQLSEDREDDGATGGLLDPNITAEVLDIEMTDTSIDDALPDDVNFAAFPILNRDSLADSTAAEDIESEQGQILDPLITASGDTADDGNESDAGRLIDPNVTASYEEEVEQLIVNVAGDDEVEIPAYSFDGSVDAARVYFAISSSDLPDDVSQVLSPIIEQLLSNAELVAVLSGYHDASGNIDFNQELAKSRAFAVRDYLATEGIDEARLVLEKPVESVGSGSAREARRVEVGIATLD